MRWAVEAGHYGAWGCLRLGCRVIGFSLVLFNGAKVGWGYEGYEARARDGNGLREVKVWHHGENV